MTEVKKLNCAFRSLSRRLGMQFHEQERNFEVKGFLIVLIQNSVIKIDRKKYKSLKKVELLLTPKHVEQKVHFMAVFSYQWNKLDWVCSAFFSPHCFWGPLPHSMPDLPLASVSSLRQFGVNFSSL